jgi:hypothetical protein
MIAIENFLSDFIVKSMDKTLSRFLNHGTEKGICGRNMQYPATSGIDNY